MSRLTGAIGQNASLISIAEMAVEILLFDFLMGKGMSRHGGINGLIGVKFEYSKKVRSSESVGIEKIRWIMRVQSKDISWYSWGLPVEA